MPQHLAPDLLAYRAAKRMSSELAVSPVLLFHGEGYCTPPTSWVSTDAQSILLRRV